MEDLAFVIEMAAINSVDKMMYNYCELIDPKLKEYLEQSQKFFQINYTSSYRAKTESNEPRTSRNPSTIHLNQPDDDT